MANSIPRWFGEQSAAGIVQAAVVALLVAALTSVAGWWKGLSSPVAVLFGVAVVLGISIAANYISLIVFRHRNPLKSPADITGQTEVEKALILSQSRVHTVEEDLNKLQIRYDDTEWLRDIADIQKREIRSWIEIETCVVSAADLFRRRPHLDFELIIRNNSIYDLSFGELSGSLGYTGPITGKAEWVGAPLRLSAFSRNSCFIRFTLDDPEDASSLLNTTSLLTLNNLKARVETSPETTPKEYSFVASTDVELIRKQHPKLKIEIEQARLTPHYNFDEKPHNAITGSLITLRIEFRNPRSSEIRVKDFKLDTSPHVERITSASTGLIYGKVWMENGKLENRDRLTPNLKDDVPIAADREEPIEGWLQFYLSKVAPGQLNGRAVNLIIVDDMRVEHVIGTPVLNVTHPDLHAR